MNDVTDQVQKHINADRGDPVATMVEEATNWLGGQVEGVRLEMADLAAQINDAQARLADARANTALASHYIDQIGRLQAGLVRYRDGQAKRISALERRLRETMTERHVIEEYDSGV